MQTTIHNRIPGSKPSFPRNLIISRVLFHRPLLHYSEHWMLGCIGTSTGHYQSAGSSAGLPVWRLPQYGSCMVTNFIGLDTHFGGAVCTDITRQATAKASCIKDSDITTEIIRTYVLEHNILVNMRHYFVLCICRFPYTW